jgi:GDP-L-fucose synthase
MMNKDAKIYVAGHRGMVGSAIVRRLQQEGFGNLVLRTSAELDLRNQVQTHRFFEEERPEYVFLAAAKVGGIHANNTYRADFIYDNLAIEMNVIHSAWQHKVRKLLFLGSSCIYPREAPQPLKEEYLLSGYLEQTNEPYAIAKIAGIKLCESFRRQYGCNFISAMPTNLYGPNDNYDLENSHVLPALIRKFHEARIQQRGEVHLWGSGTPLREFLHVDDVASASLFLMENYNEESLINIGSGHELSIRDLALLIATITGFGGEVIFDPSRPDGTMRKIMDSSKIHRLGWSHRIGLEDGIRATYKVFQEEYETA